MIGEKIPVLDSGYVQCIEVWGSDERIIESARMSTAKGFLGWGGAECPDCREAGRLSSDGLFANYAMTESAKELCKCKGTGKIAGDEKLLRYLYEHKHSTPFEMGGLTIEVQAPIFVFREWHRHRTQSYNEMSARYVPLPDVNYIPSAERLLQASSSQNRQQQAISGVLDASGAQGVRDLIAEIYKKLEHSYQHMLQNGVTKELARVILPVGRYSRMRASANLRNWLAFLTLRMDPAAQYEIRMYANEVAKLIDQYFPYTYDLFNEGRSRG